VIIRKSAAEIEGMARAGELVHETLQLIAEHLEPGVSMLELDRLADEHIVANGGKPTSKGYKGFPAALCISPNSMVVHGIPTEYRAVEGDLISVDLGVTLNGLVADSAVTLGVGEIDAEAQRLLDVCQEALAAGIDAKGATIDDFRHVDGARGSFQDLFSVHQREGEPCPVCGTAVRKLVVGGRGTYVCEHCQPRPAGRLRRRSKSEAAG